MKFIKLLYSVSTLLVLTAFLIVFCIGYSIVSRIRQEKAEQQQQTLQWTAQACRNAQNYISEKYGFQAEIISTEQDWISGMFGRQMQSDILVRMQYQDTVFDVGINGRTSNTDGFDSYQTEDILNFIRSESEKAVPGVYDIILNQGEFAFERLESPALFSTYFDGANAPELLAKSKIIVRYIQKDLSVMKNYLNFRRFQHILFISYRSEETLQDCPVKPLYRGGGFGAYDGDAVYFNHTYEFLNREEYDYQYEIGQYQNIYYYVPDGSPQDVTVSEIEPDPISSWKLHYRAEFASKAWKIQTAEETNIYIFIPESEVSVSDGIHRAVRRNDEFSERYIRSGKNADDSYYTEYFHLYPDEEFYFLYLK